MKKVLIISFFMFITLISILNIPSYAATPKLAEIAKKLNESYFVDTYAFAESNGNKLTIYNTNDTSYKLVYTLNKNILSGHFDKDDAEVGSIMLTDCIGQFHGYSKEDLFDTLDSDQIQYYTLEGHGIYVKQEKDGSFTYKIDISKKIPIAKPISSVLIIPPTKTKYDVGEKLDLTGLSVTILYTDGSIDKITEGYTISGYNKNKEGRQNLTINYMNYSRTFQVKVGNSNEIVNTNPNNNTNTNIDNIDKIPQTGDFFDLKDGLYLLCIVLSIILVYIIFKSFKYSKNDKSNL